MTEEDTKQGYQDDIDCGEEACFCDTGVSDTDLLGDGCSAEGCACQKPTEKFSLGEGPNHVLLQYLIFLLPRLHGRWLVILCGRFLPAEMIRKEGDRNQKEDGNVIS